MSFFGTRDLALLLPDQVGDAFSLRHSSLEETEEYHELKPKIDLSKKVTRYFPGQTPTWIKYDDVDDLGSDEPKSSSRKQDTAQANKSEPVNDPRLARLAKLSSNKNESAESSGRGRRRIEAQVIVEADHDHENTTTITDEQNHMKTRHVTDETNEDDIVEEEDDIHARRQRIIAKRQEQVKQQEIEPSEDSSSASEASEYETDTDESSEDEMQRFKPVFIPKHLRSTIKDQAMIEAEEELKLKKKNEEDYQRKQHSRTMLAESLKRREDEVAVDHTDADSDAGLPDDTDDPNDAVEFENWKIRELTRLKRDALMREQSEHEKKELDRRRHMSEEERLAEDKKLGIGIFKEKDKEKWKFMQRYYHKGVFYMDEDSTKLQAVDSKANDKKVVDVRQRDYSAPTLDDNYNKEQLPSVLQVKKFGMKGRTKYTHLVDQDTTDFRNPLKPNHKVLDKYMSKRSGVGDIDSGMKSHKRQKL